MDGIKSPGYAAQEARARLAPFEFERRDPRPDDVVVEIQFCGVCHSDIHQVRNEWNGLCIMVPGRKSWARWRGCASVKKFKIGDAAASGARRFVPHVSELQGR